MLDSFPFFTNLQNNCCFQQPLRVTNEFNFVLDMYHFLLMGFYIIDMLSSPEVIYVFDIQNILSLASRSPFRWVPVTFSHDHNILRPCPCFLMPRDISSTSCTFSPLDLKSTVYPRSLGSFQFRDHNLDLYLVMFLTGKMI